MFCSKCGEKNEESSKFCKKCGAVLGSDNKNNLEKKDNTNKPFNFFKYLVGILLKPFETFKENEKDLTDTKNSFILGGISAGLLMLVVLLISMFSIIRVANFFTGETSWVWSNLGHLNYLNLILKNLLIYACVLLAIAGLFYLGGLIIKKQLNFPKLLSITATSIVPFAALILVAYILGMIWWALGVIALVLGIVYFISILCTLMDCELKLEKDQKIYFYSVYFAVLLSILYFVSTHFLFSGIMNGLSMFG